MEETKFSLSGKQNLPIVINVWSMGIPEQTEQFIPE